MKRFKHKKAWRELAGPALFRLPKDILTLVLRVHLEAHNMNQRHDLSLPWPSDDLRDAFKAIDPEELAKASRIVWAAGHWHPGSDNWFRPLMHSGSYEKFSAYADEILRERIGLSNSKVQGVWTFEVHEGFIRACVTYDKSWQWTEVALATYKDLEVLKKMARAWKKGESIDEGWDNINKTIDMMKFLRPEDEPITNFFEAHEQFRS